MDDGMERIEDEGGIRKCTTLTSSWTESEHQTKIIQDSLQYRKYTWRPPPRHINRDLPPPNVRNWRPRSHNTSYCQKEEYY